MTSDYHEASGDVADAKPYGNWFDLIETELRTMVHGFIETTIAEERDTTLGGRATGACGRAGS